MNLNKLKRNRVLVVFLIDLFLLFILILNLNLIVFDWIFASEFVQKLFYKYIPSFYQFYNDNIHKDFLLIDLFFVAIFLTELIIRWIIAIKNKRYHKWFFYPFVHWYDTLSCIPVGAFRFLRIIRIISIIIRLHKLSIIDITKSYLFNQFTKYLNMLVEEVSDRVVVNVLNGIQDEIKHGNPVSDRIFDEVVFPKKEFLIEWLSERIQQITHKTHESNQEQLREYIKALVKSAADKNEELKRISIIPIFGETVSKNFESAIGDITFNVINSMITDLSSGRNKTVIKEITNMTIDSFVVEKEETHLNEVAKNIILDSIDLIKDQVKIKQWQIRELEEREEKIKAKVKFIIDE